MNHVNWQVGWLDYSLDTRSNVMQIGTKSFNPTQKSVQKPAAAANSAPQEATAAAPKDQLPNLDSIRERAATVAVETKDAAPEAKESKGLGLGTKAALAGLTGVVAMGALAGTAQAADFDITIGPGGIGVHIGDGHHHHRRGRFPGRHRRRGGDRDGVYICQPKNQTDGPYWHGIGLDGQYHRFDRHNEVNDESGHYSFVTDSWGNVVGVNCNVQHDGYWGNW